jgi:hypothetical protein
MEKSKNYLVTLACVIYFCLLFNRYVKYLCFSGKNDFIHLNRTMTLNFKVENNAVILVKNFIIKYIS